jgi:hypothetical protein
VFTKLWFYWKTGTTPSKLKITRNPSKPQYDDLTERILADAPSAPVATGSTASSELWN